MTPSEWYIMAMGFVGSVGIGLVIGAEWRPFSRWRRRGE